MAIPHPLPLISHPSSLIPHPLSLIPHPVSLIPHPPYPLYLILLIPYPSSLIPHPLSLIPHPSSLLVWCGVVSCPAVRCAVLYCAVLRCAVLCRGAAVASSEQSVWGSVSGMCKKCSNRTLPSAQSFVEDSFSDSKHGSATVIPIHISQT